jgi:hypothetical protein
MSFYLQHGYGKSQKIQTLQASGHLAGVTLSAADEDVSNLAATADLCRSLGLAVRIDPQTYVYTTAPKGSGKHHESHGVDFASIHWSQDAKATAHQVDAIGRLNARINPGGDWIAPSVLQSSFADVWTPVALQLARTASDAWGPDRTIATLVIDEAALETWSAIDDWLDVATTLEVKGFYILVGRSNTSYPPVAWSQERLSNMLRLIYNLSELNGYEVSWGYSDSEGLLGIAAGATGMSSGWSYTLRQFNPSKWQPKDSAGGRAPVVRYNLNSLWSSLRVDTEASRLFSSSLRDRVFTPKQLEAVNVQPLTTLTRAEAQEQHLGVLAARADSLGKKKLTERLEQVTSSLESALSLMADIDESKILLESRYRPRVESLLGSLERFRKSEGL